MRFLRGGSCPLPPTLDPRPIRATTHPLVLGAAALIIVNDFVLRGLSPGWLTGKLSDVGWLVVAPVLLAAVLSLARVRPRLAQRLGLGGAALFYVLLQAWPPLGLLFRADHVADLGDLLCLPALIGALVAWRTPPRTPRALWGIPLLAGVLAADDWSTYPTVSSPCGDDMEWSPEVPLLLQILNLEGPAYDNEAFLRGLRLTDGTGADVPLVVGAASDLILAVCARDGLRGDTDYTWELGPWGEYSSNQYIWVHDALPTVHFHTLPGSGVPADSPATCAALALPVDTGDHASCGFGAYRLDTGDTGDTGA
jgi:hypothetical protein